MEFAIPGFIQRFCTPNALSTLQEYLTDYASPATRAAGERLMRQELDAIENEGIRRGAEQRIGTIRETDERDLYV
jgi:2-iminoacetate synthase